MHYRYFERERFIRGTFRWIVSYLRLRRTRQVLQTAASDQSRIVRQNPGSEKITLNFADDFPPVYPTDETDIESLNEYNTLLNQAPYATAPAGFKQNGYEMDDVDFSHFGVYVLDGTDRNIQKAPNVRENLKVDVTNRPGVSYDGESVFYKAKDVAIKFSLSMPITSLNFGNAGMRFSPPC